MHVDFSKYPDLNYMNPDIRDDLVDVPGAPNGAPGSVVDHFGRSVSHGYVGEAQIAVSAISALLAGRRDCVGVFLSTPKGEPFEVYSQHQVEVGIDPHHHVPVFLLDGAALAWDSLGAIAELSARLTAIRLACKDKRAELYRVRY